MGQRWIVDDRPSRRYPIYTRANVGEVFPDPVAPLGATLAITPSAEPGWRDALVRFGLFDEDEFDADNNEIIGIFGGYCYLNVSITRLMGVRMPGMTPDMIDRAIFGEQPGVPPYEARDGDESPEHEAKSFETMIWVMTTPDLPELEEDRAYTRRLRADRPDVRRLSEADLIARARDLYGEPFRRLFAHHLFVTTAAQIPLGILTQVCEGLGDPTLTMRLIAGIGDVESAAPSWAMWDLGRRVAGSPVLTAEFDAGVDGLLDRLEAHRGAGEVDTFLGEFAGFVEEFGSRGPNEWETRSPTWETKPELALAAIDRMRLMDDTESPQRGHDAVAADREQLGAEVSDGLADQPELKEQFDQALAAAQVFLAGRERSKTNAIRLTQEVRVLLRELGRRMVEAGLFDEIEDFGLLTNAELDVLLSDPASLADRIRERRTRIDELSELEPPFVFVGEQPPEEDWVRRDRGGVDRAGPGDELVGIPGCPGRATGRARVVLDPSDPTALEPGDVLVAPITDPSWTPLFVPAEAVVVDVGAALSHAIIVSRELGIPCVVSVAAATKRIPDGALVTVDGSTGIVTIEEG